MSGFSGLYSKRILLADDDKDDQLLFKEALEDLHISAHLTTVDDGEELMKSLKNKSSSIPDVIFLDLNMPRKSGMQCLKEKMQDEKLKDIPVVIFSTSLIPEVINVLHKQGADYYIRKPGNYSRLKELIHLALDAIGTRAKHSPTPIEEFVLSKEPAFK